MKNDVREQLNSLSAEDRELLELLLAEEGIHAPDGVIAPRDRTAKPVPLSFAQQRLWFLHQLEPESAAYHIASAYRLAGRLDVPALERSLRAVVQRHEALRTVFIASNGVPEQAILDKPDVAVPMIDLAHLPTPEREAAALDLAAVERARPFDLARNLMVKARVFRLGEQEHILSITMHHIASDGWSMPIFWRELAAAYAAFADDQRPEFTRLPVQYADYALWQREALQGERLESLLGYWRQQLAGLPVLQLPTDARRPETPSFHGAGERFALSSALVEKLRGLARQEATTLHTVLLTAYAVLLARMAEQDDLAIGMPTAGRTRVEIEPLIGFFVNTLVIRAQLAGNPSFRELLRQMRQTVLAALDHQDIPFEMLVEALSPERHLNQSPLCDTIFQLLDLPQSQLDLPGLAASRVDVPNRHARFDMECLMVSRTDGVFGNWRYATDLFRADTIRRMIGYYQTMLAAIAEDPETAVGELPLLAEEERRQILWEWSVAAPGGRARRPASTVEAEEPGGGRARRPAPTMEGTGRVAEGRLVHQMVEAEAARAPEAVAMVSGEQALTYGQLNARANQVAHRLRELGVGPGAVVGLVMERTPHTMIGLLAILKAGAAYVPLEPAFPPARLRWILQDSAAALLLAPAGQAGLVGALEVPTLDPAGQAGLVDAPKGPALDPAVAVDPEHLVYIMYTSGSTGRPKGVAMRHGPLASLIAWHRDHPILGYGRRTLQYSSLSFDVSFQEIFSTWATGGQLVLVEQETRQDPYALAGFIREQRIQRLFLPNVALQQLAAVLASAPGDMALQEVISAGEQLRVSAEIRSLAARSPGFTLHNHYGPTEAHVVSHHILGGDAQGWPALPPIGRPLPGARLYVLDRHGQTVPAGVPGELAIGGSVLAQGYLGRPDLTAERFVPDPFAGEPGGRMYLTGDLVRWLPNGALEYLQRNDGQVKIRGYRVEPGEVEAVLQQHPAVDDCAVVAHAAADGELQLAAYWVARGAEDHTASDLRRWLRDRLPEYLVPAFFVRLDSWPITATGKVDRRGLPAPAAGAAHAVEAGPATATERALADIWCQVLGLEQVGRHDDFFDLGGHSLLGVRLFAAIEERFGERLPLALLFRAPTIAELAAQLQQPAAGDRWRTLVALQEGGCEAPLFLVHGFGGGVLGYADLARLLGPGRPIFGLQAAGLDGEALADTTIEAMATRYIAAMREAQPQGPYRVGGYCLGGVVAYEMARQLEAQGEATALVAIMEGYAPSRYRRRSGLLSTERWLVVWRNIPYWWEDYWALGIAGVRVRVSRQGSKWRKSVLQRLGVRAEFDAQDVLADDLSAVPGHHRQLMETHLAALRGYAPEPMSGGVTLFAARGRTMSKALFASTDPEHGWGSLAQGGVEIRVVEGGHRNIHLQPYVPSLAAALEESLRVAEGQSHR